MASTIGKKPLTEKVVLYFLYRKAKERGSRVFFNIKPMIAGETVFNSTPKVLWFAPVGQDGIGTTDGNNRYDHFLISPDLASEEAIACQIQTFSGEEIAWEVSDHIPVLAVFSTQKKYKDRE